MNQIYSLKRMLVICAGILWLGGCAGSVTVAKKYPMHELPYVEWQVDGDRRSIDRLEFINLSEWVMNAEHTIKKYERQVDMFNDSSD